MHRLRQRQRVQQRPVTDHDLRPVRVDWAHEVLPGDAPLRQRADQILVPVDVVVADPHMELLLESLRNLHAVASFLHSTPQLLERPAAVRVPNLASNFCIERLAISTQKSTMAVNNASATSPTSSGSDRAAVLSVAVEVVSPSR
ncbi:hypothetical protein PR003_g618 [Phytophthora rubi]|uniref:Uncharacterized protein n=1 Tax=Phytophthora rubi TaxID=129364 RepID=A0A6A4G2M6_9STRA|nr:hypothetical protein PR002_g81 [Phytophthora rubi]KAE9051086.1 hypothetical protein PR001_g1800 [Phytophthora rubi]KAE9359645.1 hypothetical protein PR003_g618 [Phytophthora rubi]